jgi:uncharacterized protein (TIRG00374 family)
LAADRNNLSRNGNVSKGNGLGGEATTKSRVLKALSLILRISVAIGAMTWVLLGTDWSQLTQIFMRMSLWLFALCVAVFVLGQVLLAIRWWLLLWVQDIPMKVGMAIKLHLLGLFYNNIMPSALGGDILRAWYVTKHTDKRLVAALSVLVDRVVAMASMLVMVLIVYLFFVRGHPIQLPQNSGPSGSAGSYQWAWAIAAVVGVIAVLLCLACLFKRTRQALVRLWLLAWSHVLVAIRTARDSVVLYCSKPLVLGAAMGLTMLLQSVIIVTFWVLGRSLGIDVPVRYYFIIFPATWLLSALPISIAGIGLLEGGVVVLFTRLAGVPVGPATALALCQRFVWVFASFPGGIIHLLGAHLPGANSFDAPPKEG